MGLARIAGSKDPRRNSSNSALVSMTPKVMSARRKKSISKNNTEKIAEDGNNDDEKSIDISFQDSVSSKESNSPHKTAKNPKKEKDHL